MITGTKKVEEEAVKLEQALKDPIVSKIKASLLKQKTILAKGGFDISTHWGEMIKSIKK